MQSTIVRFEIKKSALDKALILIRDFVNHVQQNESGTTLYHSFQDEENPCEFVLIMSFESDEAEEIHHESEQSAVFAKELLSMCSAEPEFQLFNKLL